MSETTLDQDKGRRLQDTRPLVEELNSALRRAAYLEKGSDYGGVAKEYTRASEVALKLSEYYKSTGQAHIGTISREDWVLMTGYKNKAGVYAGKARDAKALSNGLRV